MSEQQFLFVSDLEPMADGSIRVRPRRLCDSQDVSVKRAAAMLKFKDRETIYKLIATGQLTGWKPKSTRGNAKWRVNLGSVIDYRDQRTVASRG